MLPVKKIMCPTDFSEPSFEGLKAANELAHHFSAQLIVLHVNAPVPVMPEGHGAINFNIPEYQKEMEQSAKKQMERVIQRWVAADVEVNSRVVEGYPADQIANIANEIAADLIVIATHGHTGWRRLVLGSVTEKVVRLAQRPVLTIRFPYEAE